MKKFISLLFAVLATAVTSWADEEPAKVTFEISVDETQSLNIVPSDVNAYYTYYVSKELLTEGEELKSFDSMGYVPEERYLKAWRNVVKGVSSISGFLKKHEYAEQTYYIYVAGVDYDKAGYVSYNKNVYGPYEYTYVHEDEAQIGETSYKTLAEAAKAVKDGETIKLTGCIGDMEVIYLSDLSDVTLDFNGKGVYNGYGDAFIVLENVTNFAVKGEGKYTTTYMDCDPFSPLLRVDENSSASVSGVTCNMENHSPIVYLEGGKVVIKGGKYIGGNIVKSYNAKSETVIEDCEYEGDRCPFSLYGGMKLTVLGGKYNVARFIEGYNYSLLVRGGLFSDRNGVDADEDNDYELVSNDDEVYKYKVIKGSVKPYQARIGETLYKTLYKAVESAEDGDKIVVLTDVVLGSTRTLRFYKEGSYTLDLNGKSVSMPETNYNLVEIEGSAHLTIEGNGKMSCSGVKEGNYILSSQLIYCMGDENASEPTALLTIKNGEFKSEDNYVINTSTNSEAIIDGGEFTGKGYCLSLYNSSMYINDGDFHTVDNSNTSYSFYTRYGSKAYVYGGRFDAYVVCTDDSRTVIRGGEYTTMGYLTPAEGYSIEETSDEVYKYKVTGEESYEARIGTEYYGYLSSAVEDAEEGDIVVALADIDLGANTLEFAEEGDITLDLNGKSIASEADVIIVKGSDLTIKGDGKLEMTGEADSYCVIVNLGSLAVENGTFVNEADACINHVDGDGLVINGGKFDGNRYSLKLSNSTFVINGGEFGEAEYTALIDGDEQTTLTVNGGRYNFTNSLVEYRPGSAASHSCTGGKFTKNENLNAADGYKVVENEESDSETFPYTIVNATITGIEVEEVKSGNADTDIVKTIENGKIVIIKKGEKYDVMGRKI